MGIIMKLSSFGSRMIPPSSNLYTGIPFVKVLFFFGLSNVTGHSRPIAYPEFLASSQKFVLQKDKVQETLRSLCKQFLIFGLISCWHNLQHQTSFFSDSLTKNIHQVIFKIIVSLVSIGHRKHQTCCLHYFLRIVIVFGFCPSRSFPDIQSRTGTEQGFMRTLLRFLFRAVINTSSQKLPSLLQSLVICPITSLYILLQPFAASKTFGTPWQFIQQFIHHRIVFNTFRSYPYPFHRLGSTGIFLRIVKTINQHIHLTMQTYITTEVE